jgi:hypothetical protein
MVYAIEVCAIRDGLFVKYGKDAGGGLNGPSSCVWMVPGTWSE